jgi:hypothetical protein
MYLDFYIQSASLDTVLYLSTQWKRRRSPPPKTDKLVRTQTRRIGTVSRLSGGLSFRPLLGSLPRDGTGRYCVAR